MRLTLYRPTKPFYIGQHFGQSEACVRSSYPTDKTVVAKVGGACPVGFVELYPLLGMKGHTGLDCYAPDSTPLYSCVDGIVSFVSTEIERGLGVDILTDTQVFDFDDGTKAPVKTRYWHLKGLNVSLGQRVKVGDLIGWADNTGLSAGSHLHWEVKPQVLINGEWKNSLQTNGYFGNIDFEPYINQTHAQDVPGIIKKIQESIAAISKILAALWK